MKLELKVENPKTGEKITVEFSEDIADRAAAEKHLARVMPGWKIASAGPAPATSGLLSLNEARSVT